MNLFHHKGAGVPGTVFAGPKSRDLLRLSGSERMVGYPPATFQLITHG
jgi:hypothetical protein